MTFFYDLNKKLDSIREKPEVTHQQLNETDYSAKKARAGKDIGKPGKNFEKIAKSAGERYGSKAAGERVAGAVLNKLRHPKESVAEATQPTETVGTVIKRVLGPALTWKPGHSKMFKNTRRSRTQRVDDYVMKYVTIKGKKGKYGYLEANAGDQLAVDLKDALIQAGYPVHDNLLISGSGVSFQTRTPITTTAESSMAEGSDPVSAKFGKYINRYFGKIYDYGDSGLEYLDKHAPFWTSLFDKYDGDIDAIIANEPVDVLKKAAVELKGIVSDLPYELGESAVAEEGSAPMTAKQKSFAALAEPKDKITFADKIAGAKKEVDEVLGDVAADAMKKAISGHGSNKKPAADEGRIDDLMDKRREAEREHGAKAPKAKAGARFVAGKAYGGSAQKDEPEDDDEEQQAKSDQPKKRGRPKGTGRKIGAKGPTSKSKLAYGESDDMAPGAIDGDEGEYGNEGDMAKDQIHTIVRNAKQMEKILSDQEDLPEWVQSKLAKIEGMMTAVSDYIQTQHERGVEDDTGEEGVELDEKAVSKAQRKAAGIAHAAQKGEIPKSKLRGASKEMAKMPKGELHKFAATKEKDLPEKKESDKKDKVKEETPETPAKGSAGFAFGKGIYDSYNREVESMIAESMSVNMSNSTEGGRSLTITATDDDAVQLAQLLKSAGLGGGHDMGSDHDMGGQQESCPSCGMSDCGCGDVHEALDENNPDWPTNTETNDDALQYSGGLNKPKTTIAGDGQTTVPVTAVQVREDEDLDEQEQVMAPESIDEDKKCSACDCDPCECDESVEESFEHTLGRIREIAGIKEAKKPDFLDMDKDGNKTEPMSKAIKDKEKDKKVDESIFALTNQWKAYKG